jgi:DnaJ-class molecular chaperone
MSDPYKDLGLQRGATDEEIKKAYRKLAMKHHPDKGGDPEHFKKIQSAYDILGNSENRQNFDNPPDLFSQMFGMRPPPQNQGPVRRSDHMYELKISFEESFRGTSKNMKISLTKPCFKCLKTCDTCRGSGMTQIQMGPMVFPQVCHVCQGKGRQVLGCNECNFSRVKTENLNLELKIPPGIEPGGIITKPGLGEQAQVPGEEPGDLVFKIKIEDHPIFMRQGNDLLFQTKITFEQSVNGTILEIPHFDGSIHIDTADWGVIDPREDYILPGKGFKNGKMRISFNIIYPNLKTKFKLQKLCSDE